MPITVGGQARMSCCEGVMAKGETKYGGMIRSGWERIG